MMGYFKLIFASLTALMVAVNAFAQETTPTANQRPVQQEKHQQPDLSNLSLEDLMKIKVQSVFGASKYLQKVTEAPASVSIITAEEIKRYGYTTLAAAIRSVRGFYINYSRSYSDLGARGFARPGDFNTRVLLLVDGHRLSDNVYSSAQVGAEFPIDVDLIDRIEFIRGPSSSLYGTNAFFGVINVITKRGRDLDGLELSAQRSSFDSYRGRVSYGKQFASGVELLVSATLSDSKGQQRLYFKEFDHPATNNGIAENGDGEDINQMFANASWRDFSLQAVYGNRRKDFPTAQYETVFNDPGNYTEDTRGYLDLKYNKSLGKNADLTARVYYDRYYYHGDYIYSLDGEDGAVRVINKDSALGTWWGAEATITTTVYSRHKITAGTEFRKNLKQDQRSYFEDPFIEFHDDHRTSREWATYAEGQFRLTRNLLLNGGARYDHSNVFGGSTNPRFALVYNPLEKTTVKFLYGQAFRGPNVYELLYQQLGSPDASTLAPERIKTAEIVVEQYLGDHVRVAASAFSYRIRNLITEVLDAESGSSSFINVGRIKSNGFESEFEMKSPFGLQGVLSYAYQRSRDTDTGEKLTNSPAHMFKLNLNGPLGIRRTFGGLELQYLGDQRTLAGGTSESFLIANVTVLSERIKKHFNVSFGVDNLFDSNYGHPGTSGHRQEIIPQDGRTFRFKLTYRFSNK